MSEGVSESRFYMWRAVFAMAHADHVITDEERTFLERYLETVPFSGQQREKLRDDMTNPQDVHEMFSMISEPEDQGQFFQFARELCWCDGDYAAQEEEIKERLKAEQMGKLNIDRVEIELRRTRALSKMERTAEARKEKELVSGKYGFWGFLKKMVGG